MYKLKNGGIVSRPARIGDTFIGSLTDLGQFGYYAISLAKPTDAPEGQRYVDSGNGTYDEDAMTYAPDWTLEDAPAIPDPNYGSRISRLAFKLRMTANERKAIRSAAESNADLYDFMDLLSDSTYIDLTRAETVGGVNSLETAGLLGPGRADEILTDAVTKEEQWNG
jgi:hypothetical protein